MNLKDFLVLFIFFVVLVVFWDLTGAIIVVGLLLLVSFFKNRKVERLLKGDVLFKGSVVGSVNELKYDCKNKDIIAKKKINEEELGGVIEKGYAINDFNIVFTKNSFFIYRRKENILSFLIKNYLSLFTSGGNILEIKYSSIQDYHDLKEKWLSLKVFIENGKKDRLLFIYILRSDIFNQKGINKYHIEVANETQFDLLIKLIKKKTGLPISDKKFFEAFVEEDREKKMADKVK